MRTLHERIYDLGIFLAMLKRSTLLQGAVYQETIREGLELLRNLERVREMCEELQVEAVDGSRADADTLWPSDVLRVLDGGHRP